MQRKCVRPLLIIQSTDIKDRIPTQDAHILVGGSDIQSTPTMIMTVLWYMQVPVPCRHRKA